MKKLLIAMPCHSVHGGVETIMNDLARTLPSRGWEVTLGLAEGSRFNLPQRYLAEHPGVPAAHINGLAGTSEGRVRALMDLIRRIRPNIVLSARIFDLYEAVGRLKSEMPGLRFAVTIQCYEYGYLADLARWSPQVDLCVTSGRLIQQACTRLCKMDTNRVISIPGGVAPCTLPKLKHTGPLRLGYAGRIEQDQKRVFDLVEIVRQFLSQNIDFTLQIAGSGPDENNLKLAFSQIEGAKVEFLGWLGDRNAYHQFLNSLDIFLHTAEREGVSIAPREAMACGAVPVISEFTGFWTEGHFKPGTNCLSFPVGDIPLATRHITHLAKDSNLLSSLSRTAMNSESGVYSEVGALDAWAEAFNKCLMLPCAPPVRAFANQDTGRLSRMGISPAFAHKLRKLFGISMVHTSPGAEWPQTSGKMTVELRREFERFALDQEQTSIVRPCAE